MPPAPDISFVLTVYNKADVLADVLRALANQVLDMPAEYIFVDDASTDGSLAVLRDLSATLPRVTVLTNDNNAGPSIRLNQGAAAAKGRYLCLIDADELIAPNAVGVLYRLMQETGAQMAHGKVAGLDRPATGTTLPPIAPQPVHTLLEQPLAAILNGRGFVRMSWLVETALFRTAGGCDPRIFIQDESLPLRLALVARRMIDVAATTSYAPPAAERLSANRAQQQHDRFFASYNLLRDHAEFPPEIRAALGRKCISAAWKAARQGLLPTERLRILLTYAGVRTGLLAVSDHVLDRIAAALLTVAGIRRNGSILQMATAFR